MLPDTPALPARSCPPQCAMSPHRRTTCRVYARFRSSFTRPLPFVPRAKPLSFAPAGSFTVASAVRKALTAAQRLIYLEDPAFWSREELSWVNAAVKAQPALHVILLMPGGRDPNDPELNDHAILCESINRGLLDGIQSDAARLAQIRVFRRYGDTLADSELRGNLAIAMCGSRNDEPCHVFCGV